MQSLHVAKVVMLELHCIFCISISYFNHMFVTEHKYIKSSKLIYLKFFIV